MAFLRAYRVGARNVGAQRSPGPDRERTGQRSEPASERVGPPWRGIGTTGSARAGEGQGKPWRLPSSPREPRSRLSDMICPLEVPILVWVGLVPLFYPQESMSASSCALDHLRGRWSGYWYHRPD